MPRTSKVEVANPNYEVGLQPLFTHDGVKTQFVCTRRKDNGNVLGVCRGQYGLVQNQSLLDMAESEFAINGLRGFNRTVYLAKGGARMYARYDFRDKVLEVPKIGDKIGLRLTVNNSFGGSSPVTLSFGTLRLVCTNGMARMNDEFNLSQRHNLGISIDAMKTSLDVILARHSDIVKVFGDMAEIEIPQVKGNQIIAGLVKRNVLSERVADRIGEVWANPIHAEDRGRNLFNLYNAATQYLSHEFEDKHFESAQKIGGRVGNAFNEMAHNPSRIEETVLAGLAD